ncbi:MAG: heme exporter protein CcmD [Proteobacteria bacterium]|jgi:heme exporter protein D|nr:heme exporter protein CcmD [Pseudomonadota bacterium]MDA1290337.1 heme exporter protein CcmD [Pseudomonadota bacterium]
MLDAIQFSTWAEFIDMGGYGFNVWSVYALFAILVAANLILPWRKKQKIVRQLRHRLTLDAEIQSEDSSDGD